MALTEVDRTSGPLTAGSPSQLTELGLNAKLNRYMLNDSNWGLKNSLVHCPSSNTD
jgi:hypothetical protein